MARPILPTTLTVSDDEPCVLLAELDLQSPGSRGFRRYQILIVVRDDRPAEFRTDMGPPTKEESIRVLGSIENAGRIEILHTVAELREIADHIRELRSGWSRQIEPANLVPRYHDYIEQEWLARHHISVSGPSVTKSR